MKNFAAFQHVARSTIKEPVCATDKTHLPEAARLALRPLVFLNQLFHFDSSQLVLRFHHLNLCQQSEFGIFFREHNKVASYSIESPCFNDPVSGLQINTHAITGIFFLNESEARPSFELQFLEDGFACAIHPEVTAHNLQLIRNILSSFNAHETSALALKAAGAGAWLDEWENGVCTRRSSIYFDSITRRAKISLQGAGLAINTIFDSAKADLDDGTLRLSDSGTQSVLYADRNQNNKNSTEPNNSRLLTW